MNITIYFTPTKKRWQFWKRRRKLKDKDYTIYDNGVLTLNKASKGKIEVIYYN